MSFRSGRYVPTTCIALAYVIIIDKLLGLFGEELTDDLEVRSAAVFDTQPQTLDLSLAVIELSLEFGYSVRVSLRCSLILEVELLKSLDALVLLRNLAFKSFSCPHQLSHLLDLSLSAAHLTLRTLTLNVIEVVMLTCLDESYELEHDALESPLEVLTRRLKGRLTAFFLLGLW